MPNYGDLTDLHLTILSVLWTEGEATIGTIHDQIRQRTPTARKTIATLLSRLEERKLVTHRMDGRESVYRARVTKRAVLRSRMASLLSAVFHGNPKAVGAHALDPADIRAGDVEQLVALMRRLERDVRQEQ